MHIGETIKQIRERLGLRQEDVADRCNLSAEYISKIERGKVRPSINTLLSAAKGLKVKLWRIVREWEG